MSDEQAQQLAELDVKRQRTMDELEAIHSAVESVKNTMDAHPEKQEAIHQTYIEKLTGDDLSEEERQQTYTAWNNALKESIEAYNKLAAERERLHVQELILVKMIGELEARIEALREQM